MSTDFDLTGKASLITGATGGLGRQFALALARAGADVVVTGRRAELLDSLVNEIGAAGGRAHALSLDVTDMAAIEQAVGRAEELAGPLWCLVNNSGVARTKPADAFDEADYDFVMDVNAKGAFFVAQAVGKRMIARGAGGRIINIASIGALQPLGQNTLYCMSKAALAQMTRCMARDWARHHICVNAICPGYIRTEMNAAFFDSDKGHQLYQSWPRRRVGKDTDLNGLLLLLASDQSDFMTGSVILADDGQTLV